MVDKIKPIETSYNGYRFRSRLEARWAVFFDSLDIAWEYEKEGFEINAEWSPGNKTRGYLPDFYLPNTKTWVEVKGSIDNVSDDYWYMLACATDWGGYLPYVEDSFGTERGLILLFDIPSPHTLPLFPIIQHRKGGWCGAVQICNYGFQLYPLGIETYFDSSWGEEAGLHIKEHCKKVMRRKFNNEFSLVNQALTNARSARFEHK